MFPDGKAMCKLQSRRFIPRGHFCYLSGQNIMLGGYH